MLKKVLPTLLISVMMMAGASTLHAQLTDVWDTGCDVFVMLAQLDDGIELPSRWLVQNVVTGRTFNYLFEGVSLPVVVEPNGVTAHLTQIVSWRFAHNGARGVNRTKVDAIFPDPSVSTDLVFTYEGEVIGGNRYKTGVVGGSGVEDLVTGAVTFDPANTVMVLCR
jgi:hypothetical protein